ncbi:hypothetical protein, partial [Treponema endosymbiont of Eucomonympha sp.]|uniref:hypothetical protein n=1 Tax=Treponema endosymbiont of Eucomonympha sp. TaxID=1580831 RepID=UPI001930FF4D
MTEIKKYPGWQARGNAIDAQSILHNAETNKPTIYRATCVDNATNTEYPHRVDSYFEGAEYDCVFAEYRGGIRGNKNFIQSNVLPVDVDGGKPIAEFQAEFAGVRYELVTSKSHGKPKGGEPPCDRFHAVFYLDRMVTGIDEYTRLKDAFLRAHPYCDKGAKDGARFFYGNRLKSKQHIEGKGEPLCVDAILAKAADSIMPAAPQDRIEGICRPRIYCRSSR